MFFGASFISACEAARRFDIGTRCVGVDTFSGDEQAGYIDGDEVFREVGAYIAARYRACELMRTTFDTAVRQFQDRSIDLLHIDGLHTYEAVAKDFQTWHPKLSERSIVLLHDIEVRDNGFGVWRLWEELKQKYPHFEFHHAYGLGVLGTGTAIPRQVEDLLEYANTNSKHAVLVRRLCEAAAATLGERVSATARLFPAAAAISTVPPAQSSINPSSYNCRNMPCPCGSGKRYKHCHGRLS